MKTQFGNGSPKANKIMELMVSLLELRTKSHISQNCFFKIDSSQEQGVPF